MNENQVQIWGWKSKKEAMSSVRTMRQVARVDWVMGNIIKDYPERQWGKWCKSFKSNCKALGLYSMKNGVFGTFLTEGWHGLIGFNRIVLVPVAIRIEKNKGKSGESS